MHAHDCVGSHVLQMCIAARTYVTITHADMHDTITLHLISTGRDAVTVPWHDIAQHLTHTELVDACAALRVYLKTTTLPHW